MLSELGEDTALWIVKIPDSSITVLAFLDLVLDLELNLLNRSLGHLGLLEPSVMVLHQSQNAAVVRQQKLD
jgi:hypothetical protein